ncbi:inducible metalloproteinase inhibitor protein-like [Leptidea sinapis]|uniref:inducible metalloproteinase inhibitor protein-like n=1 Tax=Leptidea sinapis TaxID=189913 RepID=UPI0021354CC9|nr:inducible metalloproteinase inhibitor protein-like [Leptidea sinapis]
MYSQLFCCVIFLFAVQCYGDPMLCSMNEILDCVFECPPEKSCRNREIKFSCLDVITPCRPKCVCKKGYIRNSQNVCILEDYCEKCNGENEYYSCGPHCDNVCATLHEMNQTHCPIVNIRCNDKCYCREGYARNDQNECIPISECPVITTVSESCPPNEEYNRCMPCPPDTCTSLVAKYKCDAKACEPGCVCKTNYLRKTSQAPCTPTWECPELAHTLDFH